MRRFFLAIILLAAAQGFAQQGVKFVDDPFTEAQLRAQTKQLNQFIRRFNGEEDRSGKRLYEEMKGFRDQSLRSNYLSNLFDNTNITITTESKEKFLEHVNGNKPHYLNTHNGNWFAEIKSTFEYEGVSQDLTIFLKFEQKGKGWHWVISGIYFKPYVSFFARPQIKGGEIIHPMSHEIDFMPLNKVFQKPHNIVGYTPKDFRPDYLTMFSYDVKSNRLKFKSVNQVKYHFFQVEDYYFQISEFIRDGLNTGWLISNLVEIPEKEKEQFIKLIRYENL